MSSMMATMMVPDYNEASTDRASTCKSAVCSPMSRNDDACWKLACGGPAALETETNQIRVDALHLHSTGTKKGHAGGAQASASPPAQMLHGQMLHGQMQRRGVGIAGRASSACGCPPKSSLKIPYDPWS